MGKEVPSLLEFLNQKGEETHEIQNPEVYFHVFLKPEARDTTVTSSSS